MSKVFTKEEVAAHNKEDDCWIIINNGVYDVTDFIDAHPGGAKLLARRGGSDVSEEFNALHRSNTLQRYKKLKIGTIAGSKPPAGPPAGQYGDLIPYGDPYWYQGLHSPYYNQSHHDFRAKVRNFVETCIEPYVDEWEEEGKYDLKLHQLAYEHGVLGAVWPAEYGGTPPPGMDAFHDFILFDELARCGAGGVVMAIWFSFSIALPPILEVGSQYLKDKVARDVITGKKILSLAVTEPHAGSDVAGIKTTARREGDFFIVNGEKKFITSGTRAQYFTTAVRTGGKGMGGISLLLIDADTPGVIVKRQKTQGWLISSTAYIIFEDVKVPVKNLIGKENNGFKPIVHNFNHERFALAVMANRYARVCIEEAVKFGRVRKTFNQRLLDHQVLRHKVGEMARQVEATHSYLETVAYQMSRNVSQDQLAALCALVKVQATKTMEFCAREASQIMGGASFLRTGPGTKVERLYREVRVNAIGGGSEEILLELATKMSKL